MPTAETRTSRTDQPLRASTDSYDNIEPWFEKLAALAPDDPHRAEIREQIMHLCLPLAEHIARRFAGRGEEFEDLHQIATLGLVLAVDRFDVSRGSGFLSFAVPTIMGEVRRHFRDHTWALRVPRRTKEIQRNIGPAVDRLTQRLRRQPTAREIAAELGVELTEVTQALIARTAYKADSLDAAAHTEDDNPAPRTVDTLGTEEPCYRLLEDAMAVRPLIAALPERERRILTMRFYQHMTQSQIAAQLRVSQMQVSRILSRTLAKLRHQALGEERAA
ncbi:RNA polymerase sigma factor SigF [Nocardia otitidiscaviarum]|uniref:RNA polymerase sigma factor SigF n=1 Tax=Nocardia otitidiscaviarum TaxID=1823 RepID=UPI001894AB6C|nr:RNA polymerase sigma factor SigF [Nocardia otitidiscaviarum]MBF6236752.1 RNA polymerase sigma factor SigF [Nocardia otitidiscaviarum]